MRGFIWGACVVFSSFFGYNEIRSMSGRYASYWNAFLFCDIITCDVNTSAFRLFSLQERKKDVKICCYGAQNIRCLVTYSLSLFKGNNKIRTKSKFIL